MATTDFFKPIGSGALDGLNNPEPLTQPQPQPQPQDNGNPNPAVISANPETPQQVVGDGSGNPAAPQSVENVNPDPSQTTGGDGGAGGTGQPADAGSPETITDWADDTASAGAGGQPAVVAQPSSDIDFVELSAKFGVPIRNQAELLAAIENAKKAQAAQPQTPTPQERFGQPPQQQALQARQFMSDLVQAGVDPVEYRQTRAKYDELNAWSPYADDNDAIVADYLRQSSFKPEQIDRYFQDATATEMAQMAIQAKNYYEGLRRQELQKIGQQLGQYTQQVQQYKAYQQQMQSQESELDQKGYTEAAAQLNEVMGFRLNENQKQELLNIATSGQAEKELFLNPDGSYSHKKALETLAKVKYADKMIEYMRKRSAAAATAQTVNAIGQPNLRTPGSAPNPAATSGGLRPANGGGGGVFD